MPEEYEQDKQKYLRQARAIYPNDEKQQAAFVYGKLRNDGWTPGKHAIKQTEQRPKAKQQAPSKEPAPTRGKYQRGTAPHRGEHTARPLVPPEPLPFAERERRAKMVDASAAYREQVEADLRAQANAAKAARNADPNRIIKRRPRSKG